MNVGTRAHQLLAPPARELPCGRTHRSAPTCARFVGTRHAVSACCVIELPPQRCCGLTALLWGAKAWCLSTLLGGDKPPFVATNACFALVSQATLPRVAPLAPRGTVFYLVFFKNSSAFVKRRCHVVTEEIVLNSRFSISLPLRVLPLRLKRDCISPQKR